tara:strand:- start:265 stop:1953 length:1689 start_codon:yes stop_codon:yes gene_type:complete
MSDIRFNQWLHQSGTGGVSQVDGGHVGIGTTNPDIAVHTANNTKVNVGIVTANSIYAGNFYGDGSNLSGITGTTINNNANDRLITGSGTANTLEGESTFTFDGTKVRLNAGSGSNLQVDGIGSYLQVAGIKVWVGAGNRAHNTAVGNGALASASGGDDCTAIGHNAYQNGTTGEDNTVVGSHAMDAVVTGHRNCGFGHASLSNLTSGYDNSCYGRLSGFEMLGGYYNSYFGSHAGEKTIGANQNTFLGFKAGVDNVTGSSNVAVGSYAFGKQTETSFNVAVGAASQRYSSTNAAGNNVSVGHEALRGASDASPLTGGRNVAIGRGCMEDCRSGYRNTAIGWESLRNINSGYENVCVGYEAGRTISTGNENILIGASASPSSTSVSREMFIGNGTAGNGANTFYVHSTSGAYNGTNSTSWNQTSDQRIKKNITNFDTGLEVINQLQVRTFEYKTEDEIKSANPELTDVLPSMENVLNISGVQKGLIAQEAEVVSSTFVTTPSTGVKALVPDEIFWYMLNSIKELSAKNDALETRIKTLEERVSNKSFTDFQKGPIDDMRNKIL